MNKLEELAMKYGTDKFGKHNYCPFYYELFKDRQKTVKKVLEIGVGEALGLFMWRDFFTKARIYGAEIDPKRIFAATRIEVFLCDQASEKDLNDLIKETGTNIDLVVDDGSHKPEDQLFTLLHLFPQLDENCIYIIEDVADPTIFNSIPSEWISEMVKVGKRYDDRLIIVRKKL